MSLNIERIYNSKQYLVKEPYIEKLDEDEEEKEWTAPCKLSGDGTVVCNEMRTKIDDILSINNKIITSRNSFLKTQKEKNRLKKEEIDKISDNIIGERELTKQEQEKILEQVQKSKGVKDGMRSVFKDGMEQRYLINRRKQVMENVGNQFTTGDEEPIDDNTICNGKGKFSLDLNKCLCDSNWDPELFCEKCKPGFTGPDCERCEDGHIANEANDTCSLITCKRENTRNYSITEPNKNLNLNTGQCKIDEILFDPPNKDRVYKDSFKRESTLEVSKWEAPYLNGRGQIKIYFDKPQTIMGFAIKKHQSKDIFIKTFSFKYKQNDDDWKLYTNIKGPAKVRGNILGDKNVTYNNRDEIKKIYLQTPIININAIEIQVTDSKSNKYKMTGGGIGVIIPQGFDKTCDTGWTSINCDQCALGWYGDNCEKQIKVLNVPENKRKYSSILPFENSTEIGKGYARSMIDSELGWIAESNKNVEWMEMDLGEMRTVFGVVIQKRNNSNDHLQKIKVESSIKDTFVNPIKVDNDKTYNVVMDGDKSSIYFNKPIKARIIRIYSVNELKGRGKYPMPVIKGYRPSGRMGVLIG